MPDADRLDLIPKYLPAWQPHLISGPSGVGKTAFTAWFLRELRAGRPIFSLPTQCPPWIGLVLTDREQDDTLEWFRVAGWPNPPCFSAVDTPSFDYFATGTPKAALKKFTEILDAFDPPPNGLVVVDPVSWVAGGDLNKYERVRSALGALSQLCKLRRLTLLGIAHTSKQRADPKENYKRAQDKILGSMALLGGSGTQMALEGPDQTGEDGIYRFSWTPHHAKAESYTLTRTDNGLFQPFEDILDQPGIPRAEILAFIPYEPPTTVQDILRAVSHANILLTKRTIFRLLDLWTDQGLIDRVARGTYQRRRLS